MPNSHAGLVTTTTSRHSPGELRDRTLALPVGAMAGACVAYTLVAVMMGTTLPTPLCPLYQRELHYASAMSTVIYAVYAAGVLGALVGGPYRHPGPLFAGLIVSGRFAGFGAGQC
jgi:hypothetical protein